MSDMAILNFLVFIAQSVFVVKATKFCRLHPQKVSNVGVQVTPWLVSHAIRLINVSSRLKSTFTSPARRTSRRRPCGSFRHW